MLKAGTKKLLSKIKVQSRTLKNTVRLRKYRQILLNCPQNCSDIVPEIVPKIVPEIVPEIVHETISKIVP